jgi:hypothetical protein
MYGVIPSLPIPNKEVKPHSVTEQALAVMPKLISSGDQSERNREADGRGTAIAGE